MTLDFRRFRFGKWLRIGRQLRRNRVAAGSSVARGIEEQEKRLRRAIQDDNGGEGAEPLRGAAGRMGAGDARQRDAALSSPPLAGLLTVASLLPRPRVGAEARDSHQLDSLLELPKSAGEGKRTN